MRSQFFIFLSLSTFVALNGCKPLARQEPVNQAEMAISASGIQVVATKGKERGFCMLQSQVDGSDKDVELLTAEGSLSDKQIEKTLNSLGIWEQSSIYMHALIAAAGLGITLGAALAVAPTTTILAPIGLFSAAQGSLIFTFHRRDKRLRKVISDSEEQYFSDKKMQKFISKLRTTTPNYRGGCDHVKKTLKRTDSQAR